MHEEALKILVIESITNELQKQTSLQHPQDDQEEEQQHQHHQHEDLRAISRGLTEGRELELTILTGGLCNLNKIYYW